MTEDKLLEYFSGLTAEELNTITLGSDRGVTIPLATSNGVHYDFTEVEKKSLATAEKARKKHQKKLSRQQRDSNRGKATKDNIGKTYAKQRNIRQDPAHKSSHALVESDYEVFVFEDLPVKNMSKRAKAKKGENGKYIKNGAAAKSGLNKAILNSMWGLIVLFTRYKGLKKEKLTIEIPPPLALHRSVPTAGTLTPRIGKRRQYLSAETATFVPMLTIMPHSLSREGESRHYWRALLRESRKRVSASGKRLK
jgi:putative transposase